MDRRVPTGIEGLDMLLEGGLIKNRAILVQGGAGTGKTTFGLQYLLNGIQEYQEHGVLVSMEYDPGDIIDDMQSMGWDPQPLIENNQLRIVTPPGGFENPEQLSVDKMINFIFSQVTQINAQRLVIDSLNSLEINLKSSDFDRRELLRFITLVRDLDCTTVLIAEEYETPRDKMYTYLTHGVIQLYNAKRGANRLRGIEILKMRGTKHSSLTHSMNITQGRGIEVLPHEIDIA